MSGPVARGAVVGRFLPPHAGHLHLIGAAAALCERLAIVVRARPDDPVPAATRAGWLAELAATATVIAVADGPDLAARIGAAMPAGIDTLFAGDRGDDALAAALGARPVALDPGHATVPVRSAAVRADPLAHWRWLPGPVRPHYARTVCLHGPESTGKSTLAPRLAARFGTLWQPEYGRFYCEQFGLDLAMADLVAIGRTHAALTAAALRACERLLILDTDPLMSAAWARMLFGRADPWFDTVRPADLYLLLDTDLPWVDDGSRFFGTAGSRRRFLELSRDELKRRGLPYVVIGGDGEERFARAVAAIAAAGLG